MKAVAKARLTETKTLGEVVAPKRKNKVIYPEN